MLSLLHLAGDDKRMLVHDIETGEIYADIWLQNCVTAVTHPATYLNKVIYLTFKNDDVSKL